MPSIEQEALWYFAYGANMNRRIFVERRGMRPLSSEPAKLARHALRFAAPGIPVMEPAFATIVPSDDTEVHGVLYQLSSREFTRLGRLEATYHVAEVPVIGSRQGVTSARVYCVAHPKAGLKPSRRYLTALCEGARQAGLPDDYVKWLEGHASVHVPFLSPLATSLAGLYETALRYRHP